MAPGTLHTFSIGFASKEHDESAFQSQMAAALGTQHRTITCGSDDIAAIFPKVVEATERPVIRTAPAPLFLLSRLVRDHDMKVVLTGEGADEVFAGYDIFKESRVRRFVARNPQSKFRAHLFLKL
jgi:asparagine synthase (glutamine-hydrolysing)